MPVEVTDPAAGETVRDLHTPTPIPKCEGTWWGDGIIWFVSSHGGGPDAEDEEDRSAAVHGGQIWAHDPHIPASVTADRSVASRSRIRSACSVPPAWNTRKRKAAGQVEDAIRIGHERPVADRLPAGAGTSGPRKAADRRLSERRAGTRATGRVQNRPTTHSMSWTRRHPR